MCRANKVLDWFGRITMVAAMLLIWSMCSCSTQYVPVESVRHDSVFFEKICKDSIFVRDSVFIRQKGDTVFKDKFKLVYKYVFQRDTMLTVRRDSIPVPVPVEKKRTWWEQTKIDVGGYAVAIIVIYVLCRLMRWIIMRTRKE
jgi:hypothetical protein